MIPSRGPEHFDRLYESSTDPWKMDTSAYEAAKYRHSIEVLGGSRFTAALEVGCSIGVLTRQLASRCDALLAIDLVEAPLQSARERCRDLPHVRFQRMQIPAAWPDGEFDLFVLSEVLYFLSPEDIASCAHHVVRTAKPHGRVLMVNWLGPTDDPCTGDEAADLFIAAVGSSFHSLLSEHRDQYRIDLLSH